MYHIFKRYLHQTWNFILRSFTLLTLGFLAFSGRAGMPAADAKSGSVSNVAVPVSHSSSPENVVAGETESAALLSIDYATLVSAGESIVEASAIGYVIYNGAAVAGASVTIRGSTGDFTATTGPGALSSDPYFAVTLSDPPLNAAPGDLLKMEVQLIAGSRMFRPLWWPLVNRSFMATFHRLAVPPRSRAVRSPPIPSGPQNAGLTSSARTCKCWTRGC